MPAFLLACSGRRPLNLKDFHAKYFAHQLDQAKSIRQRGNALRVLADAQVDLNPHQIEAALFAFRKPFSSRAGDALSRVNQSQYILGECVFPKEINVVGHRGGRSAASDSSPRGGFSVCLADNHPTGRRGCN